jgi:hypothetical protein
MQLVNPPHQRKVDRARGRSSLCAQQTRFGERSFQNIILQRQRSDLGVQRLHVDGRELRRSVAAGTEYVGSPTLKLRLPRCDLVRVDIKLLSKAPPASSARCHAHRCGPSC